MSPVCTHGNSQLTYQIKSSLSCSHVKKKKKKDSPAKPFLTGSLIIVFILLIFSLDFTQKKKKV